MQREFGKRTFERPARQAPVETEAPSGKQAAMDPVHMRQAMLAIFLTVTIVGGMFILPKLGQCDGQRGAFGLDWCRLMKATVEGGVRGVAVGRGAMSAGRH